MMIIKMFRFNIILAGIFLFITSCVKDGYPPDCKKPAKPTVKSQITVNEGDTLHLSVSGPARAQFLWSGPSGFTSDKQNPTINFTTVANGGTYWVRELVGYCYSDSVPVAVTIKGDTTCNLGNNGADFPYGTAGPFTMTTSCSSGSGGYQIIASNADSSIMVLIKMNQIPTKAGQYILTNNLSPGNGQVFYMITEKNGQFVGQYTNNTNAPVYIKLDGGRVSVVVCQVLFQDIGAFSANLVCH